MRQGLDFALLRGINSAATAAKHTSSGPRQVLQPNDDYIAPKLASNVSSRRSRCRSRSAGVGGFLRRVGSRVPHTSQQLVVPLHVAGRGGLLHFLVGGVSAMRRKQVLFRGLGH